MSFLDDLLEEIGQSQKLDDATKQTVVTFLTANRDFLERLGPQVSGAFFETLYLHGAPQAWETLVGELGQPELLALLRQTAPEMDQAIDRRAQAVARFHEFADSLGLAVLRIITQLLLSAL